MGCHGKHGRRGRRFVAGTGALAGVLVAWGLWIWRTDLWVAWHHGSARAEVEAFRDFEVHEDPPPPTLGKYLEAGELGMSGFARLLRDPDPKVWVTTVLFLDARDAAWRQQPEWSLESANVPLVFIDHLRRTDPAALIRYLLPRALLNQSAWREDVYYGTAASWRWYWSGRMGRGLEATTAGLDCLEEFLGHPVRLEYWPDLWEEHTERAIDALASMWDPAALQGDRLQARVASLLARVGADAPSLEDRVLVYQRLLQRTGFTGVAGLPGLAEWEFHVHCRWNSEGLRWSGERKDPTSFHRWFDVSGALESLMYLDHPRALRVLARLGRDKATLARMEHILRSPPLSPPFRLPAWLPFLERARHLMEASPESAGEVALALSDLGDPQGAALVSAALDRETRSERKMLLGACLAALGQPDAGAAAKRLLLERWRDTKRMEDDSILEDEADLALQFVKTGDREILDGVLAEALKETRFDLLLVLADSVEGFPMMALLADDEIRSAAFVEFTCGGPSRGSIPYRALLEEWLGPRRSRLTWEATSRKFSVRE